MKKPTLTVVDQSKPSPLAPPASLDEAGRRLWLNLHNDFVIEDSAGCQIVQRICESVDSLASYDEQIARDGPSIRTASGIREHPLLKVQLATRSFIVRSLHRLNLDVIPPRTEIGRPSGGGDYKGGSRS